MKKTLLFLFIILNTSVIIAQKATVIEPDGVTTPRLTTAQRTALTAEKGKVVFDTNTNSMWYHDGSNWQQISSTGNSNLWNSSGQNIFYNNIVNNNNAASNYTNATNYSIPDNSILGITSIINVSLNGDVVNPDLITISFAIAHTWAADIKITLIMPNGYEIILVNQFGSSNYYVGSNIISLNNLASGPMITVGNSIPAGTYLPTGIISKPPGDLGNMSGFSANGDWSLKIQDLSLGDTGNLISWSLAFGANCLGTIGKVGVGKSNPTVQLDVQGNTKISGNSTVLGNSIVNAKVGIGTTITHGDLQFAQANNIRKIVFFEQGNNDHQFTGFGHSSGNMKYQIPNSGNSYIFSTGTGSTTSSEIMSIKGNGNVGIGTTNPFGYGSGGSNRILEIRNNTGSGADIQSQLVLSSTGTSGFLGGITWASSSLTGEQRTGFITNVFTSANGTKLSFYNRSTAGALIENFIIKEDGSATLVGALAQNSDVRLKTNINRLPPPLGTLALLNGYSYYWKDKTRENSLQYGLLAQEVQKIYPNLVKEDDHGMLSVNYIGLIPILIESIKELKAENEQAKKDHNTEYDLLKTEFNQRISNLEKNLTIPENKNTSLNK